MSFLFPWTIFSWKSIQGPCWCRECCLHFLEMSKNLLPYKDSARASLALVHRWPGLPFVVKICLETIRALPAPEGPGIAGQSAACSTHCCLLWLPSSSWALPGHTIRQTTKGRGQQKCGLNPSFATNPLSASLPWLSIDPTLNNSGAHRFGTVR